MKMTSRPLTIRAHEAQAIQAGRLSLIVRPMKPQPGPYAGGIHPNNVAKHAAPYIDAYCSEPKTAANPRGMSALWCWWTEDDRQGPVVGKCPLGKPGDELWCRETWKFHDWTEDGEPFIQYAADEAVKLCRVPYEIDGGWVSDTWERLSHPSNYDIDGYARDRRWRSPVTMPRWASRFTLRVIETDCKRVQEISEAEIIAMWCPPEYLLGQNWLRLMWDEWNGHGAWDRNEWVWLARVERMAG